MNGIPHLIGGGNHRPDPEAMMKQQIMVTYASMLHATAANPGWAECTAELIAARAWALTKAGVARMGINIEEKPCDPTDE